MDVNVCRICLVNMGTIDIYDDTLCGIAISSKIMYCCANIHLSKEDGLPGRICSICDMELLRAYKFILKCEAADIKLHALNQKEDCVKLEGKVDCVKLEGKVEEDNLIERDDSFSDEPYSNRVEEEQYKQSMTENPVPVVENVETVKNKNKLNAQCHSQPTLNIMKHNNKKPYTCHYCDKTYKTKVKLNIHIDVKHNPDRKREFICDYCGKAYYTKRDVKQHIEIHTGVKPYYYACSNCPSKFTQYVALLRHQHKTQHTGVKNFKTVKNKLHVKCKECGMYCDSQTTLNIHNKLTHNNKTPYSCNYCDKTYTSKGVLNSHIRTKHNPDRKGEIICELCGKTFYCKRYVKQHMLSHTGEKPYACSNCPSKFSHYSALQRHRLIHTGEKRYSCTKCNKNFSTKVELKRHGLTHTSEQNFKCVICNARYKHSSTLKQHVLLHTSSPTSFICDYCGKTFQVRSYLRSHISNVHCPKAGTCRVCSKHVPNITTHEKDHRIKKCRRARAIKLREISMKRKRDAS